MPLVVFPAQLHEPAIELDDTNPAFFVKVSTTVTPVASAGPVFPTVILKVTGCPRWAIDWFASGYVTLSIVTAAPKLYPSCATGPARTSSHSDVYRSLERICR